MMDASIRKVLLPDEEHDLAGTVAEHDAVEALRAALLEVEAPDDQLVRLGLA